MKRYLTLIILTLSHFAIGQKTNIDSLINVCQTMKEDSNKSQTFFNIAKAYKLERIDFVNTTKYAQKSIELSNKIQYYSGTVSAILLIGQTFREQSLYKEAIETFKSATRVCEEHKEQLSDLSLCVNYIAAYTLDFLHLRGHCN